jgi:hypothetical protein
VGQWGGELPKPDFDTPWIIPPVFGDWDDPPDDEEFTEAIDGDHDIYVGWTDDWIELKMGITLSLVATQTRDTCDECQKTLIAMCLPDSRQHKEWLDPIVEGAEALELLGWIANDDWRSTAYAMSRSKIFLGDLSAQWVLANALGIPTVIMEPCDARHSMPIFWYEHPRNTMVIGNDGKPTFDARHTRDAVEKVLRG